ncbi:hypothetical protein PITCH_A1550002 [uncultured Desulfobacterium sp.]|uniref:Uncharacterized protein n=1 Tax=uncultured Desulfobacterium sp. TaxID=201089 RepID=A0A445MTK1_9BACT|nr:hypothetical protein PITCH_A1550002 [uncultured Desulfobacterium sp.]
MDLSTNILIGWQTLYGNEIERQIYKYDQMLSDLNFIISEYYASWEEADETLVMLRDILTKEIERLRRLKK